MATSQRVQALLKKMDEAGVPKNKQALYLGQFKKETGNFARLTENMNYSAEGLMATWPSRFPTIAKAREAAAGGPQAIAKIVYNNRNGNTEEGDGYKYRGRGFIQVTGKDNYKNLSKLLFGDENVLLDDPEILSDPEFAADASIAWLNSKTKGLTTADEISNVVNSGENATKKAERKKYSDAFEKQLTLNNSGFQVDVDGIIMPEGETETAWNKYISSRKAGAGRGFVNPEFNAPAGYNTIPNGAMPVAYDEVPQPVPQAQPTYDYIPQQPVPYTPSAPMSDFEQPQYATMEDLLADRGLMGTRGL